MAGIPVITRPSRSNFSQAGEGARTPPVFIGGPFSPLGVGAMRAPASPSSPLVQPGTMVPRAPVVHFFVCDFANAKVKAFSEQFVEQLVENGVKVYCEKFLTHQPGFQVRAASLNTMADFFFQMHSKTAGRGDVRLYVNGLPKRMTREEAVAEVWAWWRLKSGALSKEEVDVISDDKIRWLLKEFADVGSDIGEIQVSVREAIMNRTGLAKFSDQLRECESLLVAGRSKVAAARCMNTEWVREPGAQLNRCIQMPVVSGLSPPLKELLSCVIDESLAKVRALIEIVERERPNVREEEDVEERAEEIPIGSVSPHDGSMWRLMVESVDEDHVGSIRIASYGDMGTSGESFGGHLDAPFMLDDY